MGMEEESLPPSKTTAGSESRTSLPGAQGTTPGCDSGERGHVAAMMVIRDKNECEIDGW